MSILLSVGLEPKKQKELSVIAINLGHDIYHVAVPEECTEVLKGRQCDVIFYALSKNRQTMMSLTNLPGSPDIIALVDLEDTSAAEYAVQSGCWDVIGLPSSPENMQVSLSRCLYHRVAHQAQLDSLENVKRDGIVGDSPILEHCLRQMHVVARSDASVLILGETGTGKELFAKAVHDNSPRAGKPFIVVDCTNLPSTLAESILFGHVKGSFTGAMESTDGLFKLADNGTIFLDEIGELDLSVQKSLLRVIQERSFRPLSAKKEIQCDFRIIAATNQDLEEMVQEGKFRQDLYHRINTRIIMLPSLRDRIEDIPRLAAFYTRQYCENMGYEPKSMAAETIEAMKLYYWPGNVRELVNVVQATVLNGIAESRLYPQHLPDDIRLFLIRSQITAQELANRAAIAIKNDEYGLNNLDSSQFGSEQKSDNTGLKILDTAQQEEESQKKSDNSLLNFTGFEELPSLKNVREEIVSKMERAYLIELIRRSNGNFSDALKTSDLSRARLYELLQKHTLSI